MSPVKMLLYLLTAFLAAVDAQAPNITPNLQPVIQENNAVIGRFNYFDLELLKEFGEKTPGNVFISPASIKATLAMILEGAKGKCAEELGSALRINNLNQDIIRQQLTRLLFDLNDSSPNTILESANAIFVSNKFTVVPEYKNKIVDFYKGSVNSIDFTNAKAATTLINNWAKNATHGEIPQIVGDGNLVADTTIVVANALFFKGKWKTAFDIKDTKMKCFSSPTRGCVNVPMMHITDTFSYALLDLLHAHAVELPYEDDRYSMLVLLPAEGNDIRVLSRDMQHANFYNIIDLLKPTDMTLEMPRFDIEFTTDLIEYLKPLKIQEIFGSRANLTGIINKENVGINKISHTTIIEVNEQGTKAAAATAAIVIPLMGLSSQKLVVDHPFMFFIYHKETRNIIFEGILTEPVTHTKNDLPPPPPPNVRNVNNVQQRVPVHLPRQFQQQRFYAVQRPRN